MEKKKKVLIVDDDERHLQTTREILEMAGYEVAVHNSPFRTTERVNSVRPDVVLLDINMPALPGDKLCALIRTNAHDRKVPIVFFSSNDEDSLRGAVRDSGATDYVCKGDVSGLRRKLQQLTS